MLQQTHSLCLLERASDYSHLYETLGKYLADGYGVIYAAEPDPERVIQRMTRNGLEAEKFVKDGLLRVLSGESIYASSNNHLDARRTLESWMNAISQMINDTKAKGVLAIGSADAFIKRGQQERVAEYENCIGKKFQTPVEAVCCYNADSLSDTSVGTLIAILNAHQYIIHDNSVYSEWEDGKLRGVLIAAFDKVLGVTTSSLVLKMLKSVYKLDEKSVIYEPTLLEDVLRKFFGDSSTVILAAILKNLKSEMAFCRQAF